MLAVTLLAGLVGSSLATPFYSPWNSEELFKRAISSGCSATGTASCTNSSAVSNTCCFQAPGDFRSPSTGPSNSWTIHGLWPDHCDSTFDESCDSSRAYTGISSLLTAQGASDTLAFMNTYWKDINGKDETFWEHDGQRTLDVKCLPSGSAKGQSADSSFEGGRLLQHRGQTVQDAPTYQWLEDAGITPSSSTTHTLASLTAAIKKGYGFTPALDCSGSAVSEVYYYYHLKGSVIDGTFVPIDAPKAGSCPSSGIKYLTKTGSPTTSTTTTGAPTSIPTKATIQAMQGGSQVGGLLSLGTWSTQTLATYTLSGSASSLKLSSSKGTCGVSGGVFGCGNGDSSTFSAVSSGGLILLAYQGDTSFSSDDVPSGSTVYDVNTGGDDSEVYTLSIVST
ncbi:ribonuclease T2-like protein [Mycena leptocephala]|nr:ribonuclease T2-like protein [Mycena leptocephala]